MGSQVLCTAASGWGASKRGASLGPAALLLEGGKQLGACCGYEIDCIAQEQEAFVSETETPHARFIEEICAFAEKSSVRIAAHSRSGRVPFVLSGDHSSATGIIGGLCCARPEERLGVVWIDAHPDLQSPYTSSSGNVHGMALAAALGLELQSSQSHLTQREEQAWVEWKRLGGGRLRSSDVVFVALRSIDPPEQALISQEQMSTYPTQVVRKSGTRQIAEAICQDLEHCTRVFVSFDIDSVDKSMAPGTGTPVDEGLTIEEAKELNIDLVTLLTRASKLCGWEMTELNPLLDHEGVTVKWAADLLISTLEAYSTSSSST